MYKTCIRKYRHGCSFTCSLFHPTPLVALQALEMPTLLRYFSMQILCLVVCNQKDLSSVWLISLSSLRNKQEALVCNSILLPPMQVPFLHPSPQQSLYLNSYPLYWLLILAPSLHVGQLFYSFYHSICKMSVIKLFVFTSSFLEELRKLFCQWIPSPLFHKTAFIHNDLSRWY